MGRAHEVRAASMAKTAAKKSKLYAKFGKEIYMAAKNGGPDPNGNLTLRRLIERAKQAQVPTDVINRNIEKSQGGLGEDYSPSRYEGFGPGGSTVIIECLSDNANRTFGEVRSCFTKTGGKIGVSGSVSYLYDYCSHISFSGMTADDALEVMLENECEIRDIETDEDIVTIIGEPSDLDIIKEALIASKEDLTFYTDQVAYYPHDYITLSDEDLEKFKRFIDLLEELDDVQEVYHNVKLPENE